MNSLYINLRQLVIAKIIISTLLFLFTLTLIAVQLSSAHAFHQVPYNPLSLTEEAIRCQGLDDHEVVANVCREIGTSTNVAGGSESEGTSSRPVLGVIPIPDGFPTEPNQIIASAVTVLIGIAGLIFFIVLLIGGIRYLTAGGDEKATMQARQTLTNAFIGLVIVVASFLIAQILFAVFGIDALVNVI